jgi:hypothetical protein
MDAEHRFRQAATNEEKLAALEDMLSTIPKHKGTEKMQADLKRRISKLKKETQQKKGSAAKQRPFYQVDKEGAGQIALVGPPNSGKSQLLAALTHATPDVADYPFTTRAPLPGMMAFENVQIQLADLPPVDREFSEPWLFGIIRNADAVWLVVDGSNDDVLAQTDAMLTHLEDVGIQLVPPTATGIPRAKHTLLVVTKVETPKAEENFEILNEFFGQRFPMLAVSALNGTNLDRLRQQTFEMLGVIRLYTKAPGKPIDKSAPFVLKKGATVMDAARRVHKDFAEHLKFARIWGSERFDGQMVNREHVLADGDVIEFHR